MPHEYAKELSRYIHLNPVRAKMVSRAEAYRWSSYLDYIGERKSPEWLKTSFILDYFGKGKSTNKNYQTFVEDLTNREYESPLNGATAATILGGTEFVSEITAQHIDGKQLDRDVPAIRKLTARPTSAGCDHRNNRLSEKSGIIYLCHNSGARLKETGKRFGIGESAVSQASRISESAQGNQDIGGVEVAGNACIQEKVDCLYLIQIEKRCSIPKGNLSLSVQVSDIRLVTDANQFPHGR